MCCVTGGLFYYFCRMTLYFSLIECVEFYT